MNRRTVIKQFALAGTAAVFLPGCLTDPKKVSIALSSLKVTGEDEQLLASIADTMVPATDKPGAKQVGAHLFTLVMVDDLLPVKDEEKFMDGLHAFNKTASLNGTKFMNASPAQKLEILTSLETELSSLPEAVQFFYRTSKHFIIKGYTTSEYFLTEVKPYQLIPGPVFKGCISVRDLTKSI
jgi:hypothetical protein